MEDQHNSGTAMPPGSARPPRWAGQAGAVAACTGLAFIALILLLQWLRGDLDWIDAQLSAYLHGAYGLLLRTAYCVLAAAMAWMALGLRAALAPRAQPHRGGAVLGGGGGPVHGVDRR